LGIELEIVLHSLRNLHFSQLSAANCFTVPEAKCLITRG
jgi:hypothetical protein